MRPIIEAPTGIHQALQRTSVAVWGPTTNEELVARLRAEDQFLCVVNSRRHAIELFQGLDDPNALHLRASMCAAHRSTVIAEVRRRLNLDVHSTCRVISTQVIEAGVDVDFPAVYRARAGLDSVAQASGRCNREGRLVGADGNPVLGRVYVFDYDSKAYPSSSMIQRAADAFQEVAPDYFNNLLSPEAIEAYFRLHYWQQGGDGGRGWDQGVDRQSIMECFSTDPNPKILLHAQFRTASEAYRLIDDTQTPVLVPYGPRGRKLIRLLERLPEAPAPSLLRAFDREAQCYTVGVYDRGLKSLLERGVIWARHDRYYVVNGDAYDEKLGLTFEALGPDLARLVV